MPTPTPQLSFAEGTPKVVVPVRLVGLAAARCTHGIRWAFRQAYARWYALPMSRIIISHVRDNWQRARSLATGAGVVFDVSIAFDTQEDAVAFGERLRGDDAPAVAAALVQEFTTQVAIVAADPQFADVPPEFAVPADFDVAAQSPAVSLETAAPTPAPTPLSGGAGGGGGASTQWPSQVPLPIVVGSAGALLVVAVVVVAVRRRQRGGRAAARGTNADQHVVHPSRKLHVQTDRQAKNLAEMRNNPMAAVGQLAGRGLTISQQLTLSRRSGDTDRSSGGFRESTSLI